jgi:chromosome partitioning protein
MTEPRQAWLTAPEEFGRLSPTARTADGDDTPDTPDAPETPDRPDGVDAAAGADDPSEPDQDQPITTFPAQSTPAYEEESGGTNGPIRSAHPADSEPLVSRVAVPPDLDEELRATVSSTGNGDNPATVDLTEAEEQLDPQGRPRHPGSVAHPLPRCLAVANQKGGVGKTTTTVNLGASLAELGYRVLVVDLDPQGNATTGLGVNGRNLDASVYDVILHDVPIEDVIEPTTLRNLFVVPATIDLAGAEIELVPVFSRELRLRRALETIESDFDFLLIDCPPSLGLLTVNALAAAGEVLVPIQCEYYALEGLSQLLRNVNLVKSNLNNRLEVSTIVLTMYDARTKLAEQVADEVREHFGTRVCRNVVPRTVRLSEAPSFGQPVTTFDSSSRGAIAYRELAKEVSGGAPQRVR